MARTPKKQITWKVDRQADPPTRHRQYFPDSPINEASRAVYEKCLIPGGMFVLKTALRVPPRLNGFEEPPFPYAGESWYVSDTLAGMTGDVAIYTGTVRVEEHTGKGLIRVPRHSFIIRGGRYLMTNLNLLDPIIQELPGHT
jgi:hypothetical protein